jgi:hypothetical protein
VFGCSENNCVLKYVTAASVCLHCFLTFKDHVMFIKEKSNIITYVLKSKYGPGVDSTSNRNKYLVYVLGVKAAGV